MGDVLPIRRLQPVVGGVERRLQFDRYTSPDRSTTASVEIAFPRGKAQPRDRAGVVAHLLEVAEFLESPAAAVLFGEVG